jgi:hypothetical protein
LRQKESAIASVSSWFSLQPRVKAEKNINLYRDRACLTRSSPRLASLSWELRARALS